MSKKIAIINNKGGSAKTTTAVNLAGAYAKRFPSKRVLIVEVDGQGNATRSFNLDAGDYESTMYDIFMGNKTPAECVINAFQNIDLIPANMDMNFVEFDEMNLFAEKISDSVARVVERNLAELQKMTSEQIADALRSQLNITDRYFNMLDGKFLEIDNDYDLIIFDTPPEIKAVTSSILAIADEVIIPFEPDTYSFDGILNILKRITTIKKDMNPKLHIAGLLAVKVRANTKLHIDVINTIMKYCNKAKLYYFQTEIPNSIRFASATSYAGLPATIAQKSNVFVQSYYRLLDELIEMGVI